MKKTSTKDVSQFSKCFFRFSKKTFKRANETMVLMKRICLDVFLYAFYHYSDRLFKVLKLGQCFLDFSIIQIIKFVSCYFVTLQIAWSSTVLVYDTYINVFLQNDGKKQNTKKHFVNHIKVINVYISKPVKLTKIY